MYYYCSLKGCTQNTLSAAKFKEISFVLDDKITIWALNSYLELEV